MEIELREYVPLRGQPSDEARRKSKQRQSADGLREVELKEPVDHTVGNRSSESAAQGGAINLQEQRTVSTPSYLQHLNGCGTSIRTTPTGGNMNGNTQPNTLPTLRESYDRCVEAFKRMGYSDEAAKGRDGEPSDGDLAATLREAHASGNDAKFSETVQASMIESFKRMGYSDEAARRAATPRGEWRY